MASQPLRHVFQRAPTKRKLQPGDVKDWWPHHADQLEPMQLEERRGVIWSEAGERMLEGVDDA